MRDLLNLLEKNARLSNAELAAMLDMTPEEVAARIKEYEDNGIIRGYATIIDWETTGLEYISARVEVKVTPKKDRGFEELAEQIAQFEEVQSLYLISGGYDFGLTVVGKTIKDVAHFVSYRLAVIDDVQSTATHFILRKYKEKNFFVEDGRKDERRVIL